MPKASTWEKPRPIQVYVIVPQQGGRPSWISRVGNADHESEIAKMIADDRKAMGETFGGLIEPVGTKGRTYRAFRAEWTEIAI